MAQARKVKVGQTWTAQVSKKRVKVLVAAERTGPGGRKQFQIKNLDTNRTSSKWWSAAKLKTLVTEPAPVAAAPVPPQAPARPAPARRKPRSRKPPVRARPARAPAPVEAEVLYGDDDDLTRPPLESLRGRRSPPRRQARQPRPQAGQRPQSRQPSPPPPAYPSQLAEQICEAIKQTDGSEYAIRSAISTALAAWRYQHVANPLPPPARYPPPQHRSFNRYMGP